MKSSKDYAKETYKQTEIGEIPDDWEVVKLGKVSDEIYRYPTYYNIKYVNKGFPEVRGELIQKNGTLDSDLSKYRFISKETSYRFPRTVLKEGDFVLSVRGTMGKVAIVPKELEGSNITANLIRISPDQSLLHPPFLKQYFISQYFQKTLNYLSPQTTIKTITAPVLKSIELPLPSLTEQKKIAEILSTADEAIQKTDEVIERAQELKKGLMQQLLTKGIDHTRFKQTEIGEIPEDWEVAKLEQLMQEPLKNGINYNKSDFGVGTKFVNVLDIFCDSLIDNKKLDRINASQKEINNYRLKTGDILIVRSSLKREGVGYPALFHEDDEPIIFCGFIIRVRPNKDIIHPLYLLDYLRSPQARERLISTSGTVAITNVNQTNLKNLKVPLPNKIEEQKKIAETLSTVDEKIEIERKRKEGLEVLKKGLMQVLLTGKVRVNVGA